MASRFTELVVDCAEPRKLAEFWAAVLGYRIVQDDGSEVEIAAREPSADEWRAGAAPCSLLFVPVPEGKSVKNRLHIDVSPYDRSRDEEVERLLALGATRADVGQGEQNWTVLADPEGNEFCVLRSFGERPGGS